MIKQIQVFEGFYTMYRTATEDNKRIVQQYAKNVYARVSAHYDDPLDQQYLQRAYEKIK